MTRHYFTHSFGIDSGGDTSDVPAVEDLSIVVEGVFLSVSPLPSSPATPPLGSLAVKGLRDVAAAAGMPGQDATFYYTQSTTQVVNTHFPVSGKTHEGGEVKFTLSGGSSDGTYQATGLVTVWGYYTDE